MFSALKSKEYKEEEKRVNSQNSFFKQSWEDQKRLSHIKINTYDISNNSENINWLRHGCLPPLDLNLQPFSFTYALCS